jgi:flagellar basal-body rod protein FlgF
MDRLVYTTLGAATKQDFLRVQLTNDLANAATTGYKRGGVNSTQSSFLQGDGFPVRFQPRVQGGAERIDMRPGSMVSTGNPLDIYLNDATVLGVQSSDGAIAFTRRGDLQVGSDGLLQTATGFLVLGNGGPISAPPGFDLNITTSGEIYATDPNAEEPEPALIGQLLLRDASNTPLLRRIDGLYEPQQVPGGTGDFPTGPNAVSVTSGAVEGSNVNPIEVMVSLLDMNRAFETQMKIIKNTEELDREGASLISLR